MLKVNNKNEVAKIVKINDQKIALTGKWEWSQLNENILNINVKDHNITELDCSNISKLDTTGALFILKFMQLLKKSNQYPPKIIIKPKHKRLYNLIVDNTDDASIVAPKNEAPRSATFLIGYKTSHYYIDFINFISFFGEVTSSLMKVMRTPWNISGRLILDIIYSAGYQAIGIITLLAFLIGIVLAYQMGGQLMTYGANIFIVKLLGLSLLREFAPLITAIIVAGRSGSAFTAQIGTMKIQEELDALRTFGISPIERLVLPRLCGLIIALPLLVVLADMSSVIGGMIMSKIYLGIGYGEFISQFHTDITFYTYFTGLIKTPVFALIIASVGCYRGLCVHGHASSIGEETTKSVVYSIFLIIVADATFSILFSSAGL